MGISDIICDSDTGEEVSQILRKMKENIRGILYDAQIGKLESQPGKNMVNSFEYKANEQLNKAGQKAGLLVQKALLPRNHLKNMVSAGSKGILLIFCKLLLSLGNKTSKESVFRSISIIELCHTF